MISNRNRVDMDLFIFMLLLNNLFIIYHNFLINNNIHLYYIIIQIYMKYLI